MMQRLLDLDQLHVLVTVVDQGSFSAAARKLGRAQSVVSYAIQELEATSASRCTTGAATAPS